jgi:hypothetical protein
MLVETGSSNTQLRIESTGSAGNSNRAGIRLYAHNDHTQEAYFGIGDAGLHIGTTDNEDIIFEPGGTANEVLRLGDDSGTNSADVWFHGAGSDTTLFISKSGNVGIGTTSPGEALEVIGNISASGTIYARTIVLSSSMADTAAGKVLMPTLNTEYTINTFETGSWNVGSYTLKAVRADTGGVISTELMVMSSGSTQQLTEYAVLGSDETNWVYYKTDHDGNIGSTRLIASSSIENVTISYYRTLI